MFKIDLPASNRSLATGDNGQLCGELHQSEHWPWSASRRTNSKSDRQLPL